MTFILTVSSVTVPLYNPDGAVLWTPGLQFISVDSISSQYGDVTSRKELAYQFSANSRASQICVATLAS